MDTAPVPGRVHTRAKARGADQHPPTPQLPARSRRRCRRGPPRRRSGRRPGRSGRRAAAPRGGPGWLSNDGRRWRPTDHEPLLGRGHDHPPRLQFFILIDRLTDPCQAGSRTALVFVGQLRPGNRAGRIDALGLRVGRRDDDRGGRLGCRAGSHAQQQSEQARSSSEPSCHGINSTITGTWSDALVQSRASLKTTCRVSPPARSGLTQTWSSRRPRSEARQSAAR